MAEYLRKKNAQGKYTDARSAFEKLRQKFPGHPEERYMKALMKAGLSHGAPPVKRQKVVGTSLQDVEKIMTKKGLAVSGADAGVIHGMLTRIPKTHLEVSLLKEVRVLDSIQAATLAYEQETGNKVSEGVQIDGFFKKSTGRMTIGRNASAHTFYHEFAHSLLHERTVGRELWASNASTGKVTQYGKTSPAEAWADAYALAIQHGVDSLTHRDPKIGRIMGRAMT